MINTMHGIDALVSVIIPVKNRRELIVETLDSVQKQSYKNWEAVIVDDGSSDGTWEILQKMSSSDSRIRPVKRKGDTGGATVTRNQGVSESRGDFILFLDSDDLLTTDTIQQRLEKLIQSPKADAIVGDVSYFRRIPGEYDNEMQYLVRPEGMQHQLEAFLTLRSPWITSGPLWRKEAVQKAGQWRSIYDNEYHTYALIAGVKFVYLGKVDWYWRLHGGDHVSAPKNFDHVAFDHVIDGKLAALAEHGLLTKVNRRMLAWSYLMSALDCAVYHSTESSSEAIAVWNSAVARKLPNLCLNLIASTLIRLQWAHAFRTLPREAARLFLYLDLNIKHPFSRKAIHVLDFYMRYMITHYKNYTASAQRMKEGIA